MSALLQSTVTLAKMVLKPLPSRPLFVLYRKFCDETKSYIDNMIQSNKVVVFMKGTPDRPMCGFSNAIVQVLHFHGVTNFDSHNVLADEKLRQDIKEYSKWPTIPQVYINSEFVGGCDIIIDMHKNGELIEELQKAGIRSRLLDKSS